MLIALLLLAGTTLAWYTMSTNPEITGMSLYVGGPETLRLARHQAGVDPSLLDYHETLNLSDLFKSYANLIPVSTADLLNWYLPTYDKDGGLKDPSEFILDDTLAYANIGQYELDNGEIQYEHEGKYYTEAALYETFSTAIDSDAIISSAMLKPKTISLVDQIVKHQTGYYVYADMWMTTDNQHGSVVRLSFPNYGVEKATEEKEMGGAFGTYVLPLLELYKDEYNQTAARSKSNNSENSVRLGFLIYGDAEDSSAITDWYIYEPNADRHARWSRKPKGESAYVAGFNKTEDTVIEDGMYAKTMPIAKVQTGTKIVEGVETPIYANQPAVLSSAHHIIQMACGWDTGTKTLEALSYGKRLNSTNLDFFGFFVPSNILATKTSGATAITDTIPSQVSRYSTTVGGDDWETEYYPTKLTDALFNIEYGQYVKIRMFVWVEGQDVDCWNDIASGCFQINLEFSEVDLHEDAAE